MVLDKPLTDDEKVRLADAINQIQNDEAVQMVWAALEETYYRQWKAAATLSDREMLWAKVSALGDLQRSLKATVDAGLLVIHNREAADKAANQH